MENKVPVVHNLKVCVSQIRISAHHARKRNKLKLKGFYFYLTFSARKVTVIVGRVIAIRGREKTFISFTDQIDYFNVVQQFGRGIVEASGGGAGRNKQLGEGGGWNEKHTLIFR